MRNDLLGDPVGHVVGYDIGRDELLGLVRPIGVEQLDDRFDRFELNEITVAHVVLSSLFFNFEWDKACKAVVLMFWVAKIGELAAFAWGAAIATYPYFGKVAEFTGRLTSIQGDCAVSEIHRRISEVYGDREVTKRATQAVIQTQANWGAIERVGKGERLVRFPARSLKNDKMVAWLIEAALRYQGKAISLATLQSLAVIYPFRLDQPLGYLMSNSPMLEVRLEGPSSQFVGLRSV